MPLALFFVIWGSRVSGLVGHLGFRGSGLVGGGSGSAVSGLGRSG